jgi:hypothetical protein
LYQKDVTIDGVVVEDADNSMHECLKPLVEAKGSRGKGAEKIG